MPHRRYDGAAMLVVKKYPNRRLYDTVASQYITLETLANKVRSGTDVLVQDAQTGADLTQATLTQIIFESCGGARLLPTPLLVRRIRMGDEALAEFLGRWVGFALEMYVGAKQGARSLLPLNPLATAPFAATDALARLMMGWRNGGSGVPSSGPVDTSPLEELTQPMPPPIEPVPEPPPVDPVQAQMDRLRREIEELRSAVESPRKTKTRAASAPPRAKKSAKRRPRS